VIQANPQIAAAQAAAAPVASPAASPARAGARRSRSRRRVVGLAASIAVSAWVSLTLVETTAIAAPASDGAVQGPAGPSVEPDRDLPLPDVDAEPGATPLPDLEPEPEPVAAPGPASEPAETPEPPAPGMVEAEQIRVAVGLASELDGSKRDLALLDQLEASVLASTSPRADLRRLRVGAAAPHEICREGRDDLVIVVGYVPDRQDPVLITYDCRLDMELGIRQSLAAEDPALLGVLWDEHRQRVDNGARERRRIRLSPKVRTGLIAGAAVVVIGVAVGLLIAGAVQRDSVVLVVGP
jgi:hypothetical protein